MIARLPAPSSEKNLVIRVKAELGSLGVPMYWKNWGSAITLAGMLDISFILPGGRYGEIECKRPNTYALVNVPHNHDHTTSDARCRHCGGTPLQIRRCESLVGAGCVAFFTDNVEQVRSRIEALL